MKIHFGEAARRHWNDAEYLEKVDRRANADQLYGLAAECALKDALVEAFGIPTKPTGDLNDPAYRLHIDQLWPQFRAAATGRAGSRALAPLSRFAEPFSDWRIDRRYAADQEDPGGAALDQHRKAAKACLVASSRARGG